MNKERRKELKNAKTNTDLLIGWIECVKEKEEEALENLPENLQESEKAEKMQEAISNMETAIEALEEAIEYIEEARQ